MVAAEADVEPTSILWRFSSFIDLTPGEKRALLSMLRRATRFAPGQMLHVQDGEPSLYFLHEGWVLSGIDRADGSRQILKIHRPGDVLGSPSLPFACAIETLTALTPARASFIDRRAVGDLFAEWPRLGAVLFLACQVERVTLMDRIVASGRLNASSSLVALLLQLYRARRPGAADARLHLPLTQPQLGEVLGLSTVHVNRAVRALERDGLIRRDGPFYDLLDISRLEALTGMPERVPERGASWLPAAP